MSQILATRRPALIALLLKPKSWITFGIAALLKYKNVEYRVTEDRVIEKRGILSNKERSASLDKITDITKNQGITDRIIGVGSVKFNTAGSDTIEIKFNSIKNPGEIADIVRENSG